MFVDRIVSFGRMLLVLVLLLPPLAARADEVLFRMQGSNTIGANLGPALVERWLRDELKAVDLRIKVTAENEKRISGRLPDGRRVAVDVAAHGSSTAFRGLASGEADIGMASRPIKDAEIARLRRIGDFASPMAEWVIALDGIAVIVHPDNPLAGLDLATLADVFSGQIRNWRALGGRPGPIHVYARDDKSGTWDTFRHLVLGKRRPLIASARRFESNAELSDAVARDPNAIGFVGLPYVRRSRALPVAAGRARARLPTRFNVETESYALTRRLYLYASPDLDNAAARDFLDYAISIEGQVVAAGVGFVAQTVRPLTVTVPETCPDVLRELVAGARRLSVDFRFRREGLALDSRALRDLDRVADYLRHNRHVQKVMLFGFSEDSRLPMHNLALSEDRADAVERALRERGVTVHHVRGFGACNLVADTRDLGRNRRVEVWIQP